MKYLIPVLVGGAGAIVVVTTAFAQAHGAFAGRATLMPYLYGYAAALTLLLIAGAMAVKAAKQDKLSQSPPSPPPAVSVHLENIGNPIHDQSYRQAIAASQPAEEPRPVPMLEVIDDKNILIAYNGREWYEQDAGASHLITNKPNAHVIVFRKKPALPGESSLPLSRVSAHLTFRGKDGSQLLIDFGTWLREYTHYVNFVRAETHSLILSSGAKADGKIDGRVYAFDNPHHTDPRHLHFSSAIVVRAPTKKMLMDNCSEVEIVLMADQTTVYHDTFTFFLDPDGTMRNFNVAS
jgi:hypothetical protein